MRGQIQYATPITVPTYEQYEKDRKFTEMMNNLVANATINKVSTYAFGRRINTTTYVR
jgi:hypothetical protein